MARCVLLIALAAPAAAEDGALARRLAALRAVVAPAPTATTPVDSATVCAARSRAGEEDRAVRAVRDASIRFGIDARLIRSVIRHESNHDPRAVSHRGAQGLMQLMPATARELGVRCPFDPRENVLGGSRYLRQLRDDLGSWPRALAAYHAGASRVRSGRLPGETRRYVARVLESWGRPVPSWLTASR